MNLLPKYLINFLFVPLSCAISLVIAGTQVTASEIVTKDKTGLPKKKTTNLRGGAVTAAAMPVRFTWQTIRSMGQGTKMSTSAETFSASGVLTPVGVNSWVLKLSGMEAPVSVTAGHAGTDGVMYIEQQDLLRLLGVVLSPSEISLDPDSSLGASKGESLQLALSRTPNRHLETVYRSPEEELFLIKAAVFLMPQK